MIKWFVARILDFCKSVKYELNRDPCVSIILYKNSRFLRDWYRRPFKRETIVIIPRSTYIHFTSQLFSTPRILDSQDTRIEGIERDDAIIYFTIQPGQINYSDAYMIRE